MNGLFSECQLRLALFFTLDRSEKVENSARKVSVSGLF